jgi:pimeloyl-ACP methyl ester carboxylesterase
MRFRLTRREDFISQFTDQATIAPQVRDTLARAMLDARADLAPAIFEAMVAGSSWEPDFALQCPTALITGERDDRFPGAREQMVRWGQSLPRDLWADVKECGHVVHLESPTGFANALHHVINKLQERR